MEREHTIGQMEGNTEDNTRTTRSKDTEGTIGQTGSTTKGNGRKARGMDMGRSSTRME